MGIGVTLICRYSFPLSDKNVVVLSLRGVCRYGGIARMGRLGEGGIL